MKRIAFIAILALLAAKAAATEFASHHLLVPVAGRTAGAHGSQWKTDLVVTNAARTGEPVSVQIFFIEKGNLTPPVVANLWPRQSANLPDFIRNSFGKEQGSGLVLITTNEPDAKIAARARIYNAGSGKGQYGQTVQAMPLTKLSKDAVLTGLSGLNGNRTNVGIANPEATATPVAIGIYDTEGEFRGSFTTSVAAFSVLTLNDVFSHFQTGPLDGATVVVRSARGVYAYASIVRSDSGDADFVAGAASELDESKVVVAPQCASPAALSLAALPAGGFSVLYKPGVDPWIATAELEGRLKFQAKHVYNFGVFFAETLTAQQIAALRCEPSIHVVEENGIVPAF